MSIVIQSFGILLLIVYVYSAVWVIRDAFDPIPEFPHRGGLLGPIRAGIFFLGTGGLVGWGAEFLFDNASVSGLIGFAAASGSGYLLMELKRRGLLEMEAQADSESRQVLEEWQALRKDDVAEYAEELKTEIRELRQKLPLEGDIGRVLSRQEWIRLWRNEATLAAWVKLVARETQQSIATDRPRVAGRRIQR